MRQSLTCALFLLLAGPAAEAQTAPYRLPSPGLTEFDEFGTSSAAAPGLLAVGAPSFAGDSRAVGAVFIYAPDGAEGWTLVQRLEPDAASNNAYVGQSVALSADGQRLITGAPLDDAGGFASGAAFVYRRSAGGAWVFEAKLTAADAQAFDEFGGRVDVDGDVAVVGASLEGPDATGSGPGAAYVFRRGSDGSWAQVAKLSPSDLENGAAFSSGVAVSGDVVAVGAPVPGQIGLPQPPTSPGHVYLFVENAGGPGAWGQVARITSDDADLGDFFGGALALHGTTLFVGANQDQDAGPVTGSTYVFERNLGGPDAWGQAVKLVPAEAESQDGIGFAVAFDGTEAAVSALGDDFNTGAVYVYMRVGGVWTQTDKLLGSAPDERFGWSVGLADHVALVGATTNADAGFASGAAYAFRPAGQTAVDAPPSVTVAVEGPWPNPTVNGSRLVLTPTDGSPISVTVIDALGRTVQTPHTGPLAPGTPHHVTVGSGLAPGVYAVRVRQGATSEMRRLTVTP